MVLPSSKKEGGLLRVHPRRYVPSRYSVTIAVLSSAFRHFLYHNYTYFTFCYIYIISINYLYDTLLAYFLLHFAA